MKILRKLSDLAQEHKPHALTIGNYDGVHLGHQEVLNRLASVAEKKQAKTAVLTFENHPSTVLRPTSPFQQICTLEHRLLLLEKLGIDLVILLPFTKEFSEQSAETFIKSIKTHLAFPALILGHDATIGKDREGDHQQVFQLASQLNFQVEYLPEYTLDGVRISSSKIRQEIKSGNLDAVAKHLGRKYSIYTKVQAGAGKGQKIGFRTANLAITGLCLPPLGVYAVRIIHGNKESKGVANLGIAPTVRLDKTPVLEVHILDTSENLYDQSIEVIFVGYLRAEQKFANIDELKSQISQDISAAKKLL